jgi:hypothetical protein
MSVSQLMARTWQALPARIARRKWIRLIVLLSLAANGVALAHDRRARVDDPGQLPR